MIRNIAGQVASGQVINASTGAAFVGTVTVYITIDGGTQTIGSVASGVCAAEGNGLYTYNPTAAETNGAQISYTFTGTGAVPSTTTYDTLTPAQAQAIQSATGTGVRYVLTIIKNALFGLNVYSPREQIKPDDSTYCLSQLNQILDDWAADIQASYAEVFLFFVSTGANPETIGSGGTFSQNARPVSIDGVAYDLGSGFYQQIFTTMDPKWWAARTVVANGGVYGAYYEPSEPLGKLYFANPPSTGTSVRVMLRTTFGPVALTDAMALPQGYESALTLTLQEAIADAFHAEVSASLMQRAGKARARIFSNNLRIPTLRAAAGTPGMARRRWNYQTGTWC